MSADLLAAFGSATDPEPHSQNHSRKQSRKAGIAEDFGFDFDEAGQTPSSIQSTNIQSSTTHAQANEDPASTWQPWPSRPSTKLSTVKPTNASQVVASQTSIPPVGPLWQRDFQTGADVLFDAENDDEDDFGDFGDGKGSSNSRTANAFNEDEDDFGDFEDAQVETIESPAKAKSGTNGFPVTNLDQAESQGQRQQDRVEHTSEPQPGSTRPTQDPTFDLLGFDDSSHQEQTAPVQHSFSRLSIGGSQGKDQSAMSADIDPFSMFDEQIQPHHDTTEHAAASFGRASAVASSQFTSSNTSASTSNRLKSTNTGRTLGSSDGDPGSWDLFGDSRNLATTNKNIAVKDSNNPEVKAVDDDDWDAFETGQTSTATAAPYKTNPNPSSFPDMSIDGNQGDEDDWDDLETLGPSTGNAPPKSIATVKKRDEPRPTNIPPPATLLQLLPRVFGELASQSPQTSKNTISAAEDVILSHRVFLRVLAGRSLRWKRDTILSQSMKISNISGRSGGSGGMKLSSLDKSETTKEDSEAEIAVVAWKDNAHKLNLIAKNAELLKAPASLVVPPSAANKLVVRTANDAGALTSNHICPLCGLKRNERAPGIDAKVDDTFGEFWVQYWGHRDCYDWWYAHKSMLGQR